MKSRCFSAFLATAAALCAAVPMQGALTFPATITGTIGQCSVDMTYDTGNTTGGSIISQACAQMLGMGTISMPGGTFNPDTSMFDGTGTANTTSGPVYTFQAVVEVTDSNGHKCSYSQTVYVSQDQSTPSRRSLAGRNLLNKDWINAMMGGAYGAGRNAKAYWPATPPAPPAQKRNSTPKTDSKTGMLQQTETMQLANGGPDMDLSMVYGSALDDTIIPQSMATALGLTPTGSVDLSSTDPDGLFSLEYDGLDQTGQTVFQTATLPFLDTDPGLGAPILNDTVLISSDSNSDFGVLGGDAMAGYQYFVGQGPAGTDVMSVPEPSMAWFALMLGAVALAARSLRPRRAVRRSLSDAHRRIFCGFAPRRGLAAAMSVVIGCGASLAYAGSEYSGTVSINNNSCTGNFFYDTGNGGPVVLSQACAAMLGLGTLSAQGTFSAPNGTKMAQINGGAATVWQFPGVSVTVKDANGHECTSTQPVIVAKDTSTAGNRYFAGQNILSSAWIAAMKGAIFGAGDKAKAYWPVDPPAAPKQKSSLDTDSKTGTAVATVQMMGTNGAFNSSLTMMYDSDSNYMVLSQSQATSLGLVSSGSIDLSSVDPDSWWSLQLDGMDQTGQSIFQTALLPSLDADPSMGFPMSSVPVLISSDSNSDFGVLGGDSLAAYSYFTAAEPDGSDDLSVPEPATSGLLAAGILVAAKRRRSAPR